MFVSVYLIKFELDLPPDSCPYLVFPNTNILLVKCKFFKNHLPFQTEGGTVYSKILYQYSKKKHESCSSASKTCKLIKQFKESSTCQRCISKFILIKSRTHQHKHVGPTNSKLRAILPLQVRVSRIIIE